MSDEAGEERSVRCEEIDVCPAANAGDNDMGRENGGSEVGAEAENRLGSTKGREGSDGGIRSDGVRGDGGGGGDSLSCAGVETNGFDHGAGEGMSRRECGTRD